MAGLRIMVIGSGGAALTKKRSCPSVLVDKTTLLDCGSGSLKNLRLSEVDLDRIQRILLSHLHNDHVGDLTSILWTMQVEGRKDPLEICGPRGTCRFVDQMLRLVRTPDRFFTYQFSCLDLIGGVRYSAFAWCRGKHVPSSLAYRIDEDGSVCYSGDTRPLPRIAKMAKGTDLLIHDSTFTNEESSAALRTNHSTAAEAGEIAKRAGVSTLLLFYVLGRGPSYEETLRREASERFGGKVFVAEDMMSLDVP